MSGGSGGFGCGVIHPLALPSICLPGEDMTLPCESYAKGIKETSFKSGLFSGLEKNGKESNSKLATQFQLPGSFAELILELISF